MYQYKKNHIEINGNPYEFEFEIRTVIQYKEGREYKSMVCREC